MGFLRQRLWDIAYVTFVTFAIASTSIPMYAQGLCGSGSGSEGDCFACCDWCSGSYEFSYGICDNGGTCDITTCTSKYNVNGYCQGVCCVRQQWTCFNPSCISEGNSCSQWSGPPCCYGLQCMSDWCQSVP